MATTETSDTNLNPRLAILVKLDDPDAADPEDVAVALIERDSITIETNEENDDFEPHSGLDVVTNPTTQNPKISVTKARAVSGDALEEFGIVDEDGNYQRGSDRTWEYGTELWYFEDDADVTSDTPDVVDEFGPVRWDVSSFDPDGNTVLYELEGHIKDSSEITLGGS